jgi:hypothetical protein
MLDSLDTEGNHSLYNLGNRIVVQYPQAYSTLSGLPRSRWIYRLEQAERKEPSGYLNLPNLVETRSNVDEEQGS